MQSSDFERDGFIVVKNAIDAETTLKLKDALSKLPVSQAVSRKNQSVYGVRNLLNLSPEVCEFSTGEAVKEIAGNFLGEKVRVVRAIYFDKTSDANWKVPWHQDLTIAVKEKRETAGFHPWTRKAEIWHVQPPIEILERMLTLRFHLDDADESNGALKVIPESHKSGRLSAENTQIWKQKNDIHSCNVEEGDCLIMRPLILHSSSAGSNPKNRRVIHLEFSADTLPNQLEWHES